MYECERHHTGEGWAVVVWGGRLVHGYVFGAVDAAVSMAAVITGERKVLGTLWVGALETARMVLHPILLMGWFAVSFSCVSAKAVLF